MPGRKKNRFSVTKLKYARNARKIIKRRTFGTNFDKVLYPYKQYCDSASISHTTITNGSIADSPYAWQFTLAMIPQANTFAALYDQYRITMIELTIRPRAAVNTQVGGTQGTLATPYLNNIIVAIDNDDAVAPANYNALREYGNAKEIQFAMGKPKVFRFKPAVAMLVYNNGITFGSSERFSPWIDCANLAVPHYGIKMVVPPSAVANCFTCDITVRYLIDFKQVR